MSKHIIPKQNRAEWWCSGQHCMEKYNCGSYCSICRVLLKFRLDIDWQRSSLLSAFLIFYYILLCFILILIRVNTQICYF